jgi:hypothetical protein
VRRENRGREGQYGELGMNEAALLREYRTRRSIRFCTRVGRETRVEIRMAMGRVWAG